MSIREINAYNRARGLVSYHTPRCPRCEAGYWETVQQEDLPTGRTRTTNKQGEKMTSDDLYAVMTWAWKNDTTNEHARALVELYAQREKLLELVVKKGRVEEVKP
ncbi:MAG: hypothetical protein U1D67_04265 [Dehalococcoidia bacterium]|nr:hypothetical protein [Dehalococcoidia bacterium]